MHIEVDQSGKIEHMNTDTYIACSNGESYCVMISKQVKQDIHFNYKNKIKQLKLKLFCIGIFYCILNIIKKDTIIILDNEYDGKENVVKNLLLDLLRIHRIAFDKKMIQISRIGKKSKAHFFAISAKRGYLAPNKKLSKEEIMKLLK